MVLREFRKEGGANEVPRLRFQDDSPAVNSPSTTLENDKQGWDSSTSVGMTNKEEIYLLRYTTLENDIMAWMSIRVLRKESVLI